LQFTFFDLFGVGGGFSERRGCRRFQVYPGKVLPTDSGVACVVIFLGLQDSSFTAPFINTSNFNLMELLCQEESDSLIKTQLNVEAISSVNI